MASTCLDTKLLAYSGTSQAQRVLDALAATYAQVDERTAANLILFAKKYAAYLNYYDVTNNANGDWQPFMSNDPAVVIAGIADWQAKSFLDYTYYISATLKSETNAATAANLFKTLFDLVFTIATNLENSLNNLTGTIPFAGYVNIAISSTLALPLNTLWQYYITFKTSGLNIIDETVGNVDPKMPLTDIIFAEHFDINQLNSASWQIASFLAPAITLDATADGITNIKNIITHNLFTGALQSFLNGIIKIVSGAPSYLQDVLENYALHQPHYALYLTFLRLFQFAQKQLNGYTGAHLGFYYKDVLKLSNAAAKPDFVHLLFELQKNVPDHILKKGTAFKAGKDAAGNNLFYTLTDDVVLHQSTVQSLQSLYLQKNSETVLYASPIANSDDGNGAKLQSVDNAWYAFGDSSKIKKAVIGFAIASNLLYLNEGSRIVTITFTCDDTSNTGSITDDAFNGKCNIQFTGKKKWFDPVSFDATSAVQCKIIDAKNFSLSITVPGNAPPIVPYAAKIHGGNFTQALPMLQLQLTDYACYAAIKQLAIISITLEVIANDVKNIVLQNDEGKLNGAKPFKPFGEFPNKGAAFIIGSKEIFQKKLTAFTVKTVWQAAPLASETVDAYALKDGQWQTPLNSNINISGNTFSITNLPSIPASSNDFTNNEDYNLTSVDGFIELQFNATRYSLSSYLTDVKNKLSQTSVTVKQNANHTTTATLNAPAVQDPPSQPVLNAVSINYTATQQIALENEESIFDTRSAFFYHMEPFGFREMHGFTVKNDKLTVLPVFNLDNNKNKDDGGELWIGLNNAAGAETFSMLFQVAEGTSNPLTPMTTVNWYYLSNDNWLALDVLNVVDQTNNFTRSGIVVVNIPLGATTGNTRADSSLIWIKAVADHDTDAICKLIVVAANAAKAVFLQDLSKNIAFTKPLASNIISKPAIADAALKKVTQPYPSFDGRIRETDNQFYVRVSERLRHKQRAVTMWDYERLVLQNYPQIHKVKCINHTGVVTDNSNKPRYSEMLPGHVTIVTIPDLQNNTTANILRPYTSIGLLTEIQQYLGASTSPFVASKFTNPKSARLHVINPQFEEVQFEFAVTFMPNHDITVFTSQLNTDIEQFLTPWACNTGKDIEFGGTIEKSVVLNFIEERDYVDYVTCFTMSQIIRDDTGSIVQTFYNLEEAVASTAKSILVSYNDGVKRHIIHSPANCDCNA